MLIFWSRFGALTLSALSMALSFCHLMELAPRLRWEPSLWMATTVFGGLYTLFGSIGAVIDLGALVAVLLLLFAVWRRPGRSFAVIGAALFFGAHALWWGFVFPMNGILATWRPDGVPTDFTSVRNQWEYSHAVIAVIKLAGFMALVLSVLDQTATNLADDRRRSGPPKRRSDHPSPINALTWAATDCDRPSRS